MGASSRKSIGTARTSQAGARSKRHSMAAPTMTRRSSVGRGRQSSAFGGGTWTARGKADPRPIRDRDHQKESVKELILFLSERQYDLSLSAKMLTRPSSKEVGNILQFLFRQIDHRFKVNAAQPEMDIAQMFATLGYPFRVTRSSLQAAGSQHTWPVLLGAIMWVLELLKYDEMICDGSADSDQDAAGADKMFFDYLSKAYAAFLSADDDVYEELEAEVKRNFAERNAEIRAEAEAIVADTVKVHESLDEIRQQVPLEQKQVRARDCASDLKKFEDYNIKIQKACKKTESQIAESEAKLAEKQAELEACKAHKAQLGEKIKSQDLNMADIERMAKEKARVLDAMQETAARKEQLQEQLWERQQALQSKTEALEKLVDEHNEACQSLELHPPCARHANGTDFAVQLTGAGFESPVFNVDVVKTIKPALLNAKARATQRLMAAREQEMELQDDVEASMDAVKNAHVDAGKLEARVKQAEARCRREKEAAQSTLARISADSDEVEDQIVQIREDDKEAREEELKEQQQVLEQLRSELAAQREQQEQLKEQINAEIVQALTKLTDHKAHVQQQVKGTKAYVQEKQAALMDD